MTTNGPLVEFAGNAIRFNSTDPTILEILATHFRHCPASEAPIIANFEITAADGGVFSARVDGSDLFSNLDHTSALWYLMQEALTRLNGASSTELIFHAAALAHGREGVVLCGQSRSGKSSLAAWLTAIGMEYMTDEVIGLPTDGEKIGGLCRSIVLKRDSAFIWQRWLKDPHSDGFLEFKDGSAWIDPTLLHPNGIRATAAPRVVLFPRYEPEAQLRAEPLTPAKTLFHLLQNLVNARNFADHGLTAAARLARHVTAFRLTYSDIESACEWIQDVIRAG